MSASIGSCSKDDLITLLQSDAFQIKINRAGIKKEFPIIKSILERTKMKKSVEQLLFHDKIEDLNNELDLDETEKDAFAKFRALVRHDDIEKRSKINFSNRELNSLSNAEICQLFQKEIEGKGCAQLIEWFCIIENEGWDGSTLLELTEAEVNEKLKLNTKQKINFKKLMRKFGKEKNAEAKQSNVMNVSDTTAGVISNAGSVVMRDTYLNGKKQDKKDSDSS